MNILNSILWVVTKPGKRSYLKDICFNSDWKGIQIQLLGGLTFDQIHGIYTDEKEALQVANELLANQ